MHDNPALVSETTASVGTRGVGRVHFFRVRVRSFEYESSFEYKSSIWIEFLRGLTPSPKVLLSLVETNFEPTECMKLHEKCALSNPFYKATFHFKLDFRQTRILNIAIATRLEVARLEVVGITNLLSTSKV